MQVDADEVLAVLRELFPRELDIAVLTAANRNQAARISELEEQLGAAGQDELPRSTPHCSPPDPRPVR